MASIKMASPPFVFHAWYFSFGAHFGAHFGVHPGVHLGVHPGVHHLFRAFHNCFVCISRRFSLIYLICLIQVVLINFHSVFIVFRVNLRLVFSLSIRSFWLRSATRLEYVPQIFVLGFCTVIPLVAV